MSKMERQEPVIDASALTLKNRVKLTWREVRGLAAESAPAPRAAAAPAAPAEPAFSATAAGGPAPFAAEESAASNSPLSAEERKAIAERLAPLVEDAVRLAMRDVIDAALANAMSRVKGDIERSLSTVVSRAVASQLTALDLSDIVRRP